MSLDRGVLFRSRTTVAGTRQPFDPDKDLPPRYYFFTEYAL
jgi:hypothetical protein